MEVISIRFDDKDEFHRLVSTGLSEGMDTIIVTKDGATNRGAAGAVIAFSVKLPDGTIRTAQTVTTVRLLKQVLRMLDARYDDEGMPRG